jgi:RimJ/RimL family protein N-acetyltransferase
VRSGEAAEAFAFHERISRSDTHIWPRTREQLSRLAQEGLLFGARITSSREIVGLCYLTADEREEEWEMGGLTVVQDLQHLGIGTFLVRFAIAHTLAFDAAPDDEAVRRVIAYVHEENRAP